MSGCCFNSIRAPHKYSQTYTRNTHWLYVFLIRIYESQLTKRQEVGASLLQMHAGSDHTNLQTHTQTPHNVIRYGAAKDNIKGGVEGGDQGFSDWHYPALDRH